MTSLTRIAAPLIAAVFAFGTDVSAQTADEGGKFENLGNHVSAAPMQSAAFTKDPSGRHLVYTVVRGAPGKLAVFNVMTGDLVWSQEINGANGSWNMCTASDGSVYIGTDNQGRLFRHVPGEVGESGEPELVELGRVIPRQSFIWDVVPGEDGAIYGGTYPDALVFRYHPDDGATVISDGPIVANENYVRGIARDAETGKIYAGVGSHAHLIELDPQTGKTRSMLPEQYADRSFAYSADVVDGHLFVRLTGGDETLVYDLSSDAGVKDVLSGLATQQAIAPSSPVDDLIYYGVDRRIEAYDPATGDTKVIAEIGANATALTWIEMNAAPFTGPTLVVFARQPRLVYVNPATGEHRAVPLRDVPRQPTRHHALDDGPDGRIYIGGYLSGGMAIVDPQTDESRLYTLSQTEGMDSLGDQMYFGVYPSARLYRFDTTRPWKNGENPRLLDTLKDRGQDRPFAVLGVEEVGKVFFGTVPDYGLHGGALAVYDPAADEVSFHREPVPQQSVLSLAYADGHLWVGTGIGGGLGIEPVTTEAKLFAWDPAREEKVFETTPIEGATAITALLTGPDGNIWGVADGVLFIFDPQTRQVTSQDTLLPDGTRPVGRWREAFLRRHPSGKIYGTSGGRLFELDPDTREVTVLTDQASQLAFDEQGRVYFLRGHELWRYTPQ